jgi:cytochrome c551/c552
MANKAACALAGVWICALVAAGHVRAAGQLPGVPQAAGAPRSAPLASTSRTRPVPAWQGASPARAPQRALLDRYCATCHNDRLKTGGLSLDDVDLASVGSHAEVWERVIRKLKGGLMPPAGLPRPAAPALDDLVAWLESEIDTAAAARPDPGRTETFHRLNRAEYRNAVRDIFALDIDVADLLPADTASYGFDNVAGALKMSESLVERYLSAARKITRAALGRAPAAPAAEVYKISPALPQDERVEGLPFGTRGGALIRHHFPQDAEYVFRFDLANTTNGAELDVTLDGAPVQQFGVKPGQRATDLDGNEINQKLEARLRVAAGPHDVGAAFLKTAPVLAESARRPFLNPTVSRPGIAYLRSVTITGPFDAAGASETPSRQRIFTCHPAAAVGAGAADAKARCAREILSTVARRAFRRPVDTDDLVILDAAYREGRTGGDFEAGIERALQQLLVSPEFLFRVVADPPRASASYRISDIELASRLSFFLWSSVPDDELLRLAERGQLREAAVLDAQVRRMLADPRAEALTTNFVGQWLHLRNLDSVTPSEVLFPDFDDGLREGLRRETELFFDSILREDRSLLDLLTADYTFVNERVARHYGIPNIQGSRFRRVKVDDVERRGLLGHGSILTITSHPVRTSPVFRGKWILETILGTPPPPPPPNVPALPEKTGVYAGRAPSMRERMAAHRDNPACASCHRMIDPLGFGLEQFDAVGRWRTVDESFGAIDATGVLPDGTRFNGVAELRAALAGRPDRFVTAFTEKLLIYALGRGVEYTDMPAVRAIVRDAGTQDYKLSAVILGIARSLPFQMRRYAS